MSSEVPEGTKEDILLIMARSIIAAMKELFSGHDWRIVLEEAPLPDGRLKKIARAHRPDAVHILAFPDDAHILLLREYRPHYGVWIWMLPSGKVDKETDIEAAAQRELQEETGFKAGELRYYCATNHSEGLVMTNHIFIARKLIPSSLPQDAHELIEVHTVGLEEAIDKVLASEKIHTPSAYGLLRYVRERGRKSERASR